jgi:hypothetical protein
VAEVVALLDEEVVVADVVALLDEEVVVALVVDVPVAVDEPVKVTVTPPDEVEVDVELEVVPVDEVDVEGVEVDDGDPAASVPPRRMSETVTRPPQPPWLGSST